MTEKESFFEESARQKYNQEVRSQSMTEKVTKTIRQAVFADEEVADVIVRLGALPQQLTDAKRGRGIAETYLKYSTDVTNARVALADFERDVAYEVAHTKWVDADEQQDSTHKAGKPCFTNPKQREDETKGRLDNLSEYSTLRTVLTKALAAEQSLMMKVIEAKAALVGVEAKFQANLAIAAMIAGLAHESTTNTTHRHTMTMKIGEN